MLCPFTAKAQFANKIFDCIFLHSFVFKLNIYLYVWYENPNYLRERIKILKSRHFPEEKTFSVSLLYIFSMPHSYTIRTRTYDIVRSTLTDRRKVWSVTVHSKQKIRNFENKVLRTICGPVFDSGTQ